MAYSIASMEGVALTAGPILLIIIYLIATKWLYSVSKQRFTAKVASIIDGVPIIRVDLDEGYDSGLSGLLSRGTYAMYYSLPPMQYFREMLFLKAMKEGDSIHIKAKEVMVKNNVWAGNYRKELMDITLEKTEDGNKM